MGLKCVCSEDPGSRANDGGRLWEGGRCGRLPMREGDAVDALGYREEHRIGLSLIGVVLAEAASKPAGFYADGGVDGGIIACVAIKDVDGDDIFLGGARRISESCVHQVPQKALTAVCPAEDTRPENTLNLLVQFCVFGSGR